jgi:hypothetical protein
MCQVYEISDTSSIAPVSLRISVVGLTEDLAVVGRNHNYPGCRDRVDFSIR